MKKIVLALFTMLFVSTAVFAQSDLQVLANVKYYKNESITLKDLKKKVRINSIIVPQYASVLKTVEGRKEALDNLIKETLILQAAQKAGFSVPDSLVDQQMDMFLSQTVGRPVTEKQFGEIVQKEFGLTFDEFFLQNTGISPKEYKEKVRNEMLVQQYVVNTNQEALKKVVPTDEQIRMFYEANKSTFVSQDILKIFVVSIPKAADAEAAKVKANQLRNKLVDKKTTPDKILVQAEAEKFQAGDMLVPKDANGARGINMTMEQLLKLFTEPVGFVSDLLETPDAYQFFSIVKKYDAKMLGISDLVQPETTVTVYDYIRAGLTQQLQAMFISQTVEKIGAELNTPENVEIKKSGEALDKLLNWGE